MFARGAEFFSIPIKKNEIKKNNKNTPPPSAQRLGRHTLKLLTTSLGVQPVVVGLGLLPDIVVDGDGEDHVESLALNTAESVEDGVVESAGKRLLGVAGNRVTGNSLLSRGA